MRLIFAGTPDAAVPSLRRLLDSAHEVVAVITRPDAPVGRGKRVARSPVGEVADEAGLRLLQPRTLRDPDVTAQIASLRPDACPVVAFGALIPPPALTVPLFGWINLHFSLLPAWRGAAPVQHAIWHGDDVTGATTFLIEEGLDTGPVFGTMVEPLGPRDTSGDVLARLAQSGASLLVATLDGLQAGKVTAVPQPADGVSLAPKITVAEAWLDWTLPAVAIDRQIRACTPAPGAWSTLRGDRVKLFPVSDPGENTAASPGQLVQVGRNSWVVGTGSDPVALGDVQPAGKRRMPASDWLRGVPDAAGESLQ